MSPLLEINLRFLDLLNRSFDVPSGEEIFADYRSRLEEIEGEVEFDLLLWSMAHRFKLDTEELMRQLGERWAREFAESGGLLDARSFDTLECLDWLVAHGRALLEAPVPGMSEFRVTALARNKDSLRTRCEGARRCCSFFEGVARGFGARNGERIRYLRQPKRATLVELTFSVFAK